FLQHLDKQYAHVIEYGLFFSNIVCDYILPQRGILFGLNIFALVVILLYHAWHEKNPRTQGILLTAAVIITGLTPLAHTHTFLMLIGLLGYLAIVQGILQRRILTPWAFTLVGAAAL